MKIFYTLDVGRYSHPKMDRKMTKHVDQDGYEVSIEMDDDRLYRTDRFEGTPLLPHSQYINLRRDPYRTNPNEIFADNFYRNPLDKVNYTYSVIRYSYYLYKSLDSNLENIFTAAVSLYI